MRAKTDLAATRPGLGLGLGLEVDAGSGTHEVKLPATVGGTGPPLPVRLIVQRRSPEATRQALRRAASRPGKTLDPRSPVAAEFAMLATSPPLRAGLTVLCRRQAKPCRRQAKA